MKIEIDKIEFETGTLVDECGDFVKRVVHYVEIDFVFGEKLNMNGSSKMSYVEYTSYNYDELIAQIELIILKDIAADE